MVGPARNLLWEGGDMAAMSITPAGYRPSLLGSQPRLGKTSCLMCFVFTSKELTLKEAGSLMTLQIVHMKPRNKHQVRLVFALSTIQGKEEWVRCSH